MKEEWETYAEQDGRGKAGKERGLAVERVNRQGEQTREGGEQ